MIVIEDKDDELSISAVELQIENQKPMFCYLLFDSTVLFIFVRKDRLACCERIYILPTPFDLIKRYFETMAEKDITNQAELNAFLKQAKATLVDFHATWCGPCKAIAPYVHQQCASNGINLAKVDVDVAQDVATKYNITAMPTFKVLNSKGEILGEVVGGGQPNVNKMVAICNANK